MENTCIFIYLEQCCLVFCRVWCLASLEGFMQRCIQNHLDATSSLRTDGRLSFQLLMFNLLSRTNVFI